MLVGLEAGQKRIVDRIARADGSGVHLARAQNVIDLSQAVVTEQPSFRGGAKIGRAIEVIVTADSSTGGLVATRAVFAGWPMGAVGTSGWVAMLLVVGVAAFRMTMPSRCPNGQHWQHDTTPTAIESGCAAAGKTRQGRWQTRTRFGALLAEGAYVDGVKNGLWVLRHKNGRIRERATFRRGKPVGRREQFAIDGKRSAVTRYRAPGKGARVEFHPNGKRAGRGQVLRDVRHGRWLFFRPNGSRASRVTFRRGRRDGRFEAWHPDGRLIEQRGAYVDGRRRGLFRWWDQSGTLIKIGGFVDGKKDGVFRWYDTGGKEVEVGAYLRDEKHGEWVRFDDKGRVSFRGQYDKGRRVGTFTWWCGRCEDCADFCGDGKASTRRPDAKITREY